jgi:hypothetical protein
MLYTHDFHILSAYLDWSRFKEPTKVVARCWDGIIAIAHNEAAFGSYLAGVASSMPANHSNKLAASEALVYKCRSMAALRKQLSNKANASSPETFQTILRLFWTKILVEDKIAALVPSQKGEPDCRFGGRTRQAR